MALKFSRMYALNWVTSVNHCEFTFRETPIFVKRENFRFQFPHDGVFWKFSACGTWSCHFGRVFPGVLKTRLESHAYAPRPHSIPPLSSRHSTWPSANCLNYIYLHHILLRGYASCYLSLHMKALRFFFTSGTTRWTNIMHPRRLESSRINVVDGQFKFPKFAVLNFAQKNITRSFFRIAWMVFNRYFPFNK